MVEAGGVEPPSLARQPEPTTCLAHRDISILQSGVDGHLQDPARMELSAPDARTPNGDPTRYRRFVPSAGVTGETSRRFRPREPTLR